MKQATCLLGRPFRISPIVLATQTLPRTRRISKQFALIDEKVLKFKGDKRIGSFSGNRDENTVDPLQRSASSLFQKTISRPYHFCRTAMENLRKSNNRLAILDGFGLWRISNVVVWPKPNCHIVCLFDIFYQNQNFERSISQLCRFVFCR